MKKNKKTTSMDEALGMIETKKKVSKREHKKAIAERVVKKFAGLWDNKDGDLIEKNARKFRKRFSIFELSKRSRSV